MATQEITSGFLTSRGLDDNSSPHISSDGRSPLTLSDTTGSTVSDYMGFGSYSGSDIQVIVHYPKSTAIQLAIKEEKDRLNKAIEEQNKLLSGNADPNIANTINNTIFGLNSELENLQKEIESIKDLPTSKVLAEVQTVSWGIYREKSPVRTLGSVYPRSFTRGPLTIAGSMIFTIFNKHVLHELLNLNLGMYNTGTTDFDSHKDTTNLIHQLPPLDFSFLFANEYGAISHMGIWGVEFIQEGATFSVEDIYSENTVQYVARDLDPIRIAGQRKINNKGVTNSWSETASDLMLRKQNDYAYRIRRNPFI